MSEMRTGAERIAAERQRQIDHEGWTPEHDAHHATALGAAASAYLNKFPDLARRPPHIWPWREEDWKPTTRVRNLEKAGALIAAEIDRLLAAPSPGDPS